MVTRQNDRIQLTLPKKKKQKDKKAEKYIPILAPMTALTKDEIQTHIDHARKYF